MYVYIYMLLPPAVHASRYSSLLTAKSWASSAASYVIPVPSQQRARPRAFASSAPPAMSGLTAEAFSVSVKPPASAAKPPDGYSDKPHHVDNGCGGFRNPWNRCAPTMPWRI